MHAPSARTASELRRKCASRALPWWPTSGGAGPSCSPHVESTLSERRSSRISAIRRRSHARAPSPSCTAESSAESSSPAVQALVSRFIAANAGGGAAVNLDAQGVLLCRRIADIPLNSQLGHEHFFLMTSTQVAGAGHCGEGIPGHGQVDLPLSPMYINDHTADVGRSGVTCDLVNADEDCVNRELELGKHLGPWAPPFNDCQTFAASVIADCSLGTSSASGGSEGAPSTDDGGGGTYGY